MLGVNGIWISVNTSSRTGTAAAPQAMSRRVRRRRRPGMAAANCLKRGKSVFMAAILGRHLLTHFCSVLAIEIVSAAGQR